LSAFFWLLTLITYTRYARSVTDNKPAGTHTGVGSSPVLFYVLTLSWLACGLMSKPMVVTLPFVLLLVDFWPLGRIGTTESGKRNLKRALLEKLPFFALAIAECFLNLSAQKGGGATWSSDILPLPVRLANALVSYLRYLSKTLWPSDLAVIYPYEKHWPLMLVLGAALFLFVCSVLAICWQRRKPYFFFGWFYFLGTLVPTIGLVQVGPQAMADRYTYLPSIGLFVILVWSLADLLAKRVNGQRLAALSITAAACACCLIAARQIKYWSNDVELFSHTVAVTSDNYVATAYLAGALGSVGRKDEALLYLAESVRISPYFPIAQLGLGQALLEQGRAAEASEHLAVAAELTPADPVIHCYHGRALYLAGKPDLAEKPLAEAVRLNPDYAEAQFFLALCLASQNRSSEALPHFSAAVRLVPDNADAQFNLGVCLSNNERWADAVQTLETAVKLRPDFAPAHFRLGQALVHLDKLTEAAAQFREALRLNPNSAEAKAALEALPSARP